MTPGAWCNGLHWKQDLNRCLKEGKPSTLVPSLCVYTCLQEGQAKESIAQLKAEIANLTRLAEAGSALSSGEEATLNELMRQKEELMRERDAQVSKWCQQLVVLPVGGGVCVINTASGS